LILHNSDSWINTEIFEKSRRKVIPSFRAVQAASLSSPLPFASSQPSSAVSPPQSACMHRAAVNTWKGFNVPSDT